MRLYHGSDCIVRTPSVKHSRSNLDFGPGFYLTSYEEQAKSWALRKAMRSKGTAYVNVYEASRVDEVRTLYFPKPDAEWVEFVCRCRRDNTRDSDYDVIVGGVANDKVYRAVDMYFRGYWDMATTLRALRYYGVNDQWCFASQTALETCVSFIESYEVQP